MRKKSRKNALAKMSDAQIEISTDMVYNEIRDYAGRFSVNLALYKKLLAEAATKRKNRDNTGLTALNSKISEDWHRLAANLHEIKRRVMAIKVGLDTIGSRTKPDESNVHHTQVSRRYAQVQDILERAQAEFQALPHPRAR